MLLLTKQWVAQLSRCAVTTLLASSISQMSTSALPALLTNALALQAGALSASRSVGFVLRSWPFGVATSLGLLGEVIVLGAIVRVGSSVVFPAASRIRSGALKSGWFGWLPPPTRPTQGFAGAVGAALAVALAFPFSFSFGFRKCSLDTVGCLRASARASVFFSSHLLDVAGTQGADASAAGCHFLFPSRSRLRAAAMPSLEAR